MENIEIEIKIKIDEQTHQRVKEFLEQKAQFGGKSREKDQYFSPSNRNFLAPEYPYEWLRLREKNDKVIFNYKHWYPENSHESTHCDEYESSISNVEAFIKILHALGINMLIKVDKTREKYVYQESFEIALDYVEELGYFIEIEYRGHSNDVTEAQQNLFRIATELQIDISKRDNRGYPFLMLEQKGLLKNYKDDQ